MGLKYDMQAFNLKNTFVSTKNPNYNRITKRF